MPHERRGISEIRLSAGEVNRIVDALVKIGQAGAFLQDAAVEVLEILKKAAERAGAAEAAEEGIGFFIEPPSGEVHK